MKKILVVDDDLDLQDLYKFTFEKVGYKVFQCFNGQEAIQQVENILPDAIILDVVMPEVNGFEVIEQIRSKPNTCLIPIIMLTSLSKTKDKLTGIKLGADNYLIKPVEPFELVTRVENLIKKYDDTFGSITTRFMGVHKLRSDIMNKISNKENFSIVCLDFNNFKVYNKTVGYEKGDNILKLFSGILRSSITNCGNNTDTIYNSDGDIFYILTTEDKALEISENILRLFDDIKRKDTEKELSIVTVALAVKSFKGSNYKHHSEVLDSIKELWLLAKQKSKGLGQNIILNDDETN